MRFSIKTFLIKDDLSDILRKVVEQLYSILNGKITYQDNIQNIEYTTTVNTLSTYNGVFGNFASFDLSAEFEVKSLRLLTAYLSNGSVIPANVGFTWHPNGKKAVIDMIYGLQPNAAYIFTWRIE